MSVKVLDKRDGLWLQFHSDRNRAIINVEQLSQKYGDITRKAIVAACEEQVDEDLEAYVQQMKEAAGNV